MTYQHFLGCIFSFLMVFFKAQKFTFLWFWIYLFFVCPQLCFLVSYLINCCLKQSHEDLHLFPSSKSCIVFLIALIFRSLIYFNSWVHYYICCEIGVQFCSFSHEQSVVPAQFLRSLFFPYWIILVPLSKINWLKCEVLFLNAQFYSIDMSILLSHLTIMIIQ